MPTRWEQWLQKNKIPDSLKDTMRREYGYLLYWGGIFLHIEPVIAFLHITLVGIYFVLISVHSFFFVVTVFKTTTLIDLSQSLNYFSLGIISIGILFGSLTNRRGIVRYLEILTIDFYDYGETFVNDKIDKWKASLQSFKIIIIVCIPCYLFIIAITVTCSKWIDMMFGYEIEDVDYINTVYQKTPVKLWYPFHISNNYERAILTLAQAMHAGILAITIGCADVLMLLLGQTVVLQLKILCSAVLKMDERAANMYASQTNGNNPPKDSLEKTKDKTLEFCYNRCITQIVEHHLILQNFYNAYNKLAKWPTAFVMVNGAVMIAMSCSVIIMGGHDYPSTFIIAGLLLVAEVLSVLMMCETGQQISEWSETLYFAMYQFEWSDLTTSNKKMIMIFKENAKQPLVMMAGGLKPINRDTFGTIINSAYTYLNLLMAREKKNDEKQHAMA